MRARLLISNHRVTSTVDLAQRSIAGLARNATRVAVRFL